MRKTGFGLWDLKNLTQGAINKTKIARVHNLLRLKWSVDVYRGLLLIILLSILVARVWSLDLNIRPSDDGWILYDVYLMTQGKMPYRDFLYSKPPLYLIVLFLFSEAFGYGYVQAKFFSCFLVAMTVIAIYVCASELFDEKVGVIAAFLGSTSIILVTGFLLLLIINLSALLFLVSIFFLVKYLKKGIDEDRRGLYVFVAGFFLGGTLLVRQTSWVLIILGIPFILAIGEQCFRVKPVRSRENRPNRGVPTLFALWAIIVLLSASLQVLGWGVIIPPYTLLGVFLLGCLFLLIRRIIEEKHQFKKSIWNAILFGVGMVSLPIILLAWLILSGVTLPLLIFNVYDAPAYDTSVAYHEMEVKQTFAVLFMAMNPLLTVGIILYIVSAVKDIHSGKQVLCNVDSLLRVLIVIGVVSIIILLPKFYPTYLIDVIPFMAIGAARAFSQVWKSQGAVKYLQLRTTKISINMSAYRTKVLLVSSCILTIVASVAVYDYLIAFEPTLKRIGETNNEITSAVVEYICAHTQPDDQIFTIDHIFAALAQRRIVGDLSTGIQIRSIWQLDENPYTTPEEIIAHMSSGEVKYVIMDPHTYETLKKWTPVLLDYIVDAYTVEATIQDVEIMGLEGRRV